MNPLHATDFYKTGHYLQYPEGTTLVYSNFTARSDKWANTLPDFDHKTVFFGLQAVCQWLLIDLWNTEFFDKHKEDVVQAYRRRMDKALGVGVVTTDHIAALWEHGCLPLHIKALPEGSRVDIRVPTFTIVNTHPDFYWVTNYVETQLSAELWKMITSATMAYEYRRLFMKYAKATGVDLGFVDFQGHDFSARGMSGVWDGGQSGAAHLTSFKGTDTIHAIDYIEDYYPADTLEELIGASVPATEHSVMCLGGQDNEIDTFRRLITKLYPAGIVSIVSDSWDYWQVLTSFTVTLFDEIIARTGKVVFRPDSGDPVKMIVGYHVGELLDPDAECVFVMGSYYEIERTHWLDGCPFPELGRPLTEAEVKGSVEVLWEIFGGTTNEAGYKTLDPHVGLIYGDSISLERAVAILEGLKQKGFSSANIVFGIGSYTYQYVTRDTYGTAIKATFGVVNGVDREVSKNPKTDSGVKKSAKGLLRVENEDDHFVLYDQQTWEQEKQGALETVFLDSKLIRKESITTIRQRLLEAAQ